MLNALKRTVTSEGELFCLGLILGAASSGLYMLSSVNGIFLLVALITIALSIVCFVSAIILVMSKDIAGKK